MVLLTIMVPLASNSRARIPYGRTGFTEAKRRVRGVVITTNSDDTASKIEAPHTNTISHVDRLYMWPLPHSLKHFFISKCPLSSSLSLSVTSERCLPKILFSSSYSYYFSAIFTFLISRARATIYRPTFRTYTI